MKYMLMIFGKQSDYAAMSGAAGAEGPAWGEKDLSAMFQHMEALNNDLAESGELLDANGLAEPARARLVTSRDGTPVVSEGTYGQSREVLAGYWLLECASIERATEIAARAYECPVPEGAPNYPVVVHPVDAGPSQAES